MLRRRRRPRTIDGRLALCALALVLAGCSSSGDRVHVADREHRVKIRLRSGPFEEITVGRDSDGGIVAGGLCFFPDGTRLTVALADSAGHELGRTQPVVDRALFHSLPLKGPGGGAWPEGRYAVDISATFAPGAQTPEVLRESKSGAAFHGEGMTTSRQGRLAYSRRFQVSL